MNNLIEKREVWIDNKILTKDDVLSLVSLFVKISGEVLEKAKEIKRDELNLKNLSPATIGEVINNTGNLSIELTTSDNLTYTGSSDKIPVENEILSKKKITEILMQYSDNVSDNKLIIKIKQSDSSKGYISVAGREITRVNEITSLIENFFLNCKNQSTFVRKYRILLIAATVMVLNFLLLNLIELFIKAELIFPKIMHSLFNKNLFVIFLIMTLITVTPAISVYNWFKKLFPRIEIQNIKNYHQVKKQKFRKILMIISLILVPTIISFLIRVL
jgi:hypothetical protein